jgi:hypothetical protein
MSAFAIAFSFSMALGSVAQPAGAAPMELSFDRATAKPGESVALPVYLVSDANHQEPFQITLEFPERHLTFEEVELDYLAERAKWTMSASVADHPENSGRRILRIEIKPGGSDFFPSGLVAHAHFAVAAGTPDGDILLAGALVAPLGSRPVPTQEAPRITVATAAMFGCFFYMH